MHSIKPGLWEKLLTKNTDLREEICVMSKPARAFTIFLGATSKFLPGLKSDKVLDFLCVQWSPHEKAVTKKAQLQAEKTIHAQQPDLQEEKSLYQDIIPNLISCNYLPSSDESRIFVDTGILTEEDDEDGFFSVLREYGVFSGSNVVKLKDEIKSQVIDSDLTEFYKEDATGLDDDEIQKISEWDLSEDINRNLIEAFKDTEKREMAFFLINQARYKVLSNVLKKPIILHSFCRGKDLRFGSPIEILYDGHTDGAIRVGVATYPKVNMHDDSYTTDCDPRSI